MNMTANPNAPETETHQPAEDVRDSTTAEATPLPNKEQLANICSDIQVNFNGNVDVKPVMFRFRSFKDPETKVETKREELELPVPYPSVTGVVDIMQAGGKQLELLMDAVYTVVTSRVRALITEDVNLNALNFPVELLSWDTIANLPKAERSGGGINKEVWEDFSKDYIKVMVEATEKTEDQIAKAAKLLQNKFGDVKTDKPVIEKLVSFLAIYIDKTSRGDEFAACVNFLIDKADKLINVTPEDLLSSL